MRTGDLLDRYGHQDGGEVERPPRAVPIVEAMTALVLLDHWMRQAAQCETFAF